VDLGLDAAGADAGTGKVMGANVTVDPRFIF
jgi:hypothetical protein